MLKLLSTTNGNDHTELLGLYTDDFKLMKHIVDEAAGWTQSHPSWKHDDKVSTDYTRTVDTQHGPVTEHKRIDVTGIELNKRLQS